MYKHLKERGRAASDRYAGSCWYFYLSPAYYVLLRAVGKLLAGRRLGKVLDAGAGRGAYRDLLMRNAQGYVGLDVGRSNATDVLGDAQRLPFADDTFDTVFCSQVLEHVPEPWLALSEFSRVLKTGGTLILTVPHISWLHNEPHDYYRYTAHGLKFLVGRCGFETETIQPAGGLFALLGHILSTLMINMTFGVPLLHQLVRFLNKLFVVFISIIDEVLDRKKVFALNYVSVFRKN